MTDVVVAGAAGFVGRHLITGISRQNDIKLRVLVHQGNPDWLSDRDNVVMIKGDLLRPETLGELCVENAVVVNLAYLRGRTQQDNLTSINNLLEACLKAKISRFIHCSTASVFGRVSGDIVNENTKCAPINEYEITKMRMEETVLKMANGAFDTVILCPTAIFGPGGKNLLKLAGDLRYGNKIVNYLKACVCGTRKMNLVSVHNVVAAIKLLMQADKKFNGEVFIVSDDEFQSNNYRYIERYLMKSFGLGDYAFPVIPVPYFVHKALLRLAGRPNFNPRCTYSCQKLLRLGFKRAVLFEDGLAEFANWYKDHPEVRKGRL